MLASPRCMTCTPTDGANTQCCWHSAFSPANTAMIGIGIGIAVAGAGTALGVLLAAACTPRHFAMPSLMADLGMIEPSFTALIAAVIIGVALIAVALGVAPTVWWLNKRSVASALSQEGR